LVKVGLIGVGGMGKNHYECFGRNPNSTVVAISDRTPRRLEGDWSRPGLNLGKDSEAVVDLTGVQTYLDYKELLANSEIDLVDICLPTWLHAEAVVAALEAGKHVLCEKPMAMTTDECIAIEQSAAMSDKQVMIGHCLRYWPEYVKASEIINGGEYGKVLSADLYRAGGTPWWSSDNWLATGPKSGGAVLDLHIHDVDTALWWFGKPDKIVANGLEIDGLPMRVDALWKYTKGPVVSLHGSWDHNGGGPFVFGFTLVMEKATLRYEFIGGEATLKLYKPKEDGRDIPVDHKSAYQSEIDDFIDCIETGRKLSRITLSASKLSVECCAEETKQIRSSFLAE
jgi:1,5-anhydro-D-fructose reductase (1,5-anhydro-D-mannitol-forming)